MSAAENGYPSSVGAVDIQENSDAREALSSAIDGDSKAALKATIQIARLLGVQATLLAKADARLIVLEDAAAQRERAEESLMDAVEAITSGNGDTKTLASALALATEAGADEEILVEARAVLKSREALAALSSKEPQSGAVTEEEAQDALIEASAGDDPDALEAAIALARAAGVREDTLAEAAEALEVVKELRQAKVHAEEALVDAVTKGNDALLEATIDLAEESGVDEEILDIARARLSAMRGGFGEVGSQMQAAKELRELMEMQELN